MWPSSATLLALLFVCVSTQQASSLSYDGSECGGYVEFALSTSADVISLDGDVATALSSFPVYITYTCKAALRRYYCLNTYTPKAAYTTNMCASVCREVLDSCEMLLEVFAEENSFGLFLYDSFKRCAEDQSKTTCVNGSTGAHFSQDEPQCFYETVVPDEHGVTSPIGFSGCALPCPGGVFHYIYPFWHLLIVVFTSVSAACAVATTYTFMEKYLRQRKSRASHGSGISSLRFASVFPVLMFCVGGLVESSVVCIALIVEIFQPRCEGNAKWRPATPMCYVESVVLLGSGMWSSCWSFVIASDAWTMVFLSLNPLRQQQIRAWHGPFVTLAAIASMIAIHINVKNVVISEAPFCLASSLRQSNVPLMNGTYWIPVTILVGLSSVMMFMVMVRVNQLDRESNRSSFVTRPSKTHLLRIFLLIVCYNCFGFVITSLVFDQELHLSKYQTNASNYFTCLLTYSTTSTELGRERRGVITDWGISEPLWVWTLYYVMVGCFGLIPFVVFGVDYECRVLVGCIQRYKSSLSTKTESRHQPGKPAAPADQLPSANPPILTIPSPGAAESSTPSPTLAV